MGKPFCKRPLGNSLLGHKEKKEIPVPVNPPLLSRYVLQRSQGFTLIETLVAVAVLAISLVVVLQLFSGGLKSGKLSDEYTRGIFYAREKMEELLLSDKLEDGVSEGEFEDGYRWEAEILRLEVTEEDEKLPFESFGIRVEVIWDTGGGDKHFEIATIRNVEKGEGS